MPNIVSREDIPVGLIDGEYAGSADPLVELAQAAWLNVRPFSDDVAEIARSGAMYIVGAGGGELRALDGTLIGRWGENGEGVGHFTNSPHGVFINDEESIYIAEVGENNRLKKFIGV